MGLIFKAGATSQSIYVEILDSASTTGGRKTGIVFNSAGLTAYYVRQAGSATSITLATLTNPNSAYSSGGFKEVDATNMPGVYRLDLPDAAIAAGSPSVVVTLKGAAGMVQVSKEIMLVAIDPQDAVRAGLTALPNANAEAAGGLYTRGSGAGQINQAANGQVDTNVKNINGVSASAVTTINANLGQTQPVNFTGTGASALVKSDAVDLGGVAQTGRDIGASVLLSAGTGAGQLDFTSGVVKSNLAQILGTALTETAGQIAAAFKQFFNIASPTSTMNVITTTTSVTNDVGITQAAADKVWNTVTRTLTAFGFSVTVGANNDKTGYGLTAGERTSVADALLDRDLSAGADTIARSVRNALRVLRNKVDLVVSPGSMVVYKEDDTTTAWSAVVTTNAAANPITVVDPP